MLLHTDIWQWPSPKGLKGHTKVNIKLVQDFDMENNAVKVQHDAYMMQVWCSQSRLKRVHKVNTKLVWVCDLENIPIKLQHDTWNFPRVYCVHKPNWMKPRLQDPKGHTKVNIKFGWNFHMGKISACKVTTWCWQIQELLLSQGIATCCHLIMKGQKRQIKVNIKLVRDFDIENIPVKLLHDAYNSWVVSFSALHRFTDPIRYVSSILSIDFRYVSRYFLH